MGSDVLEYGPLALYKLYKKGQWCLHLRVSVVNGEVLLALFYQVALGVSCYNCLSHIKRQGNAAPRSTTLENILGPPRQGLFPPKALVYGTAVGFYAAFFYIRCILTMLNPVKFTAQKLILE